MGLRENFGKIWPTVEKSDTPDWVQQRICTKNAPELEGQCLTSGNHALYVGKIVPPKMHERVARLFLGEASKSAPARTYSEEFIKAALEILFAHLEPGQKACFVVGCKLSEYCNGRASISNAMSYDDEVTMIKALAREHFQGDEGDFEVIDILDQHPKLALALEKAERDSKTGRVKLDSVFREEECSTFNAYRAAYLLYLGTKEDPQFLAQIKSLPTSELKALRTAADDELDAIDAYGLFEIAIRLTDAVRGCTFQGGIDRQAKYDNVIRQLLAGDEKFYKKSPALLSLIKLLKDVSFRAFHIDRKNNYHQKKVVQQRARLRTGMLAATGIAAAFGAWHFSEDIAERNAEAQRAETTSKAEDYFKINWSGHKCMMHDNWDRRPYSTLASNLLNETKEELMLRYGFDEETSWMLALQISEKMTDRNSNMPHHFICNFTKSKHLLIEFIDQYVSKYHLAASLHGDTPGTPYESFHEHRVLFEKTAHQNCDALELEVQSWPLVEFPGAEFLGTYSDTYEFGSEIIQRDVYLYNGWDGPVVMATVPIYKDIFVKQAPPQITYHTFVEDGAYLSAKKGCEVAKHFVRDAKSYELNVLSDEQQALLFDIFRPETASYAAHFDGVNAWPDHDTEIQENGVLKQFSTDGDWELGYYKVDPYSYDKILVAKKPGEDEFSLEAARELACWRIMNSAVGAWSSTRNWIWGDLLELDLDSIAVCPGQPNSFGRFE